MDSPNSNGRFPCNNKPWKTNSNQVWLCSTLTLMRNLDKFNFPGKLATEKLQQIQSLISSNLLKNESFIEPKLALAEEVQAIEKEYLVEHFLMQESLQNAQGEEAFITDQSGETLAALNFHDHLMLHKIDVKEDLESAWDWLYKVETTLSKSMNFAFSPKFGFLTSDSGHCGTGLTVHIFMHLPGLIYTGRLEEVLKKIKDEGIEKTGLHGDPQDMIGDIVAFHNAYTLGLTEENIITSMRTLATKLIVEEKGVRNILKQEQEANISDLKDKVSRAYAILLHSYQIESLEALQALSLLKLGLDFNWISGASLPTLNELIFGARRAHLLCYYGKKIPQEEISHKRAEFIHQSLKGITLNV